MVMEVSAKGIGHQLRRMFSGVIRRPMDWGMIDALGRLEDKELEDEDKELEDKEEELRRDEEIHQGDQDQDRRKSGD